MAVSQTYPKDGCILGLSHMAISEVYPWEWLQPRPIPRYSRIQGLSQWMAVSPAYLQGWLYAMPIPYGCISGLFSGMAVSQAYFQ